MVFMQIQLRVGFRITWSIMRSFGNFQMSESTVLKFVLFLKFAWLVVV